MAQQTFQQFKAEALAQGFDEVLERRWDPLTDLGTHTHPFAVRALMVQGELWLTLATGVRHLREGDTFEVSPEAQHAERYGPEGATYWVARRHR